MSEIQTDARSLNTSPDVAIDAVARPRGWLARIGVKRAIEVLAPVEGASPDAAPTRRRAPPLLISFLAMVIAPLTGFVAYFAVIASDRFVSETRFAVNAQLSDFKRVGSAGVTVIPSAASQEAYQVASYVRSRACIDDVLRSIDLRQAFQRPEADFWTRLQRDAGPEDLTKYWLDAVTAYVDPPSGIVIVSVTAFRREDALVISQAILKSAERVADELSAKARADLVRSAEQEVANVRGRMIDSLAALKAYREKTGVVDPRLQAEFLVKLLEGLQARHNRLTVEYETSSLAMAPTAPTLKSKKALLATVEQQIADAQAQLASGAGDPHALANILPKYEELETRTALAAKLYTLALDGLERARLRASARATYLNIFVPPTLAEQAEYPRRVAYSLKAAFLLALVWAVVVLTVANVEDHKL